MTEDELKVENARLRVALEFYADPDTYAAIVFWPDRPCGDFMNDFDEEFEDTFGYDRPMPGKTARAALKEPTG